MLRLSLRRYSQSINRRALFDTEFQRQLQSNNRRLEKIRVHCEHDDQTTVLTMNRSISTPVDCARHIRESLSNEAALALVNDAPHDMHRPLVDDCRLRFLNFRSADHCHVVNLAFWRSCSFLTNWTLETCFHDSFRVHLCSFPSPNLQSGSFVSDVQIVHRSLEHEFPADLIANVDLRSLSNSARKLIFGNHAFVPLSVDQKTAEAIFADSPLKLRQIPLIADGVEEKTGVRRVPVYGVGEHVDICQGPLIASTGMIGRFKLTAAYPLETRDYGRLFRFQGVGVPAQLPTHHTTFDMFAKRAMLPNKAALLPELKIRSTRTPGDGAGVVDVRP